MSDVIAARYFALFTNGDFFVQEAVLNRKNCSVQSLVNVFYTSRDHL